MSTTPPSVSPPFPDQLWGRKACAIVWCFSGREISDAASDVHRTFGAQLPSGHSTMHLYPGGWAGVIVGFHVNQNIPPAAQ